MQGLRRAYAISSKGVDSYTLPNSLLKFVLNYALIWANLDEQQRVDSDCFLNVSKQKYVFGNTFFYNLNPSASMIYMNKSILGILELTSEIIKCPPSFKSLLASARKSR